ncbi:MAG: hypothetical protein Ta2C_01760 [Candidatus Endomicrobiellum trichonymphae]|nr:MAG: hypothetical protein Ta2C_01760 [Candidatus Endomicrobium trichonymphae]
MRDKMAEIKNIIALAGYVKQKYRDAKREKFLL